MFCIYKHATVSHDFCYPNGRSFLLQAGEEFILLRLPSFSFHVYSNRGFFTALKFNCSAKNFCFVLLFIFRSYSFSVIFQLDVNKTKQLLDKFIQGFCYRFLSNIVSLNLLCVSSKQLPLYTGVSEERRSKRPDHWKRHKTIQKGLQQNVILGHL